MDADSCFNASAAVEQGGDDLLKSDEVVREAQQAELLAQSCLSNLRSRRFESDGAVTRVLKIPEFDQANQLTCCTPIRTQDSLLMFPHPTLSTLCSVQVISDVFQIAHGDPVFYWRCGVEC